MTDREKIIAKTLKLRALVSGASTEGEAMAAMEKAHALMEAYRIEEAELAMAEASGTITVEVVDEYQSGIMVGKGGRVRHKAQVCLHSIMTFTDTKCVLKSNNTIHWMGEKADVQMAMWLFDHIKDSMDRSFNNWKRGQQSYGRSAKGAFQMAFATAVNSKLGDLTYERRAEQAKAEAEAAKLLNADPNVAPVVTAEAMAELPPSMALVMVSALQDKREQVKGLYNSHYAKARMRSGSNFGYRSNGSASSAGRAAGSRLGLGRPVGSSRANLLS